MLNLCAINYTIIQSCIYGVDCTLFPCPVLNINVVLHVCSCLPCVIPWMFFKYCCLRILLRLCAPLNNPDNLKYLCVCVTGFHFTLQPSRWQECTYRLFANHHKKPIEEVEVWMAAVSESSVRKYTVLTVDTFYGWLVFVLLLYVC